MISIIALLLLFSLPLVTATEYKTLHLPYISQQGFTAPFSPKLFTPSKADSNSKRPNVHRYASSAQQAPLQDLLQTAKSGIIDLRQSLTLITSSKSTSDLVDNIVGAMARHKYITAAGIFGLYYMTHRSIPDPLANARRTMAKQQTKELSKWGSRPLRR